MTWMVVIRQDVIFYEADLGQTTETEAQPNDTINVETSEKRPMHLKWNINIHIL